MAPVTPGSVLYNAAYSSLPDISCMWTSARSSWIYLDMDDDTANSNTISTTTTVASVDLNTNAAMLNANDTSFVTHMDLNASADSSDDSRSFVLASSLSFARSSSSSSSTLSSSMGRSGTLSSSVPSTTWSSSSSTSSSTSTSTSSSSSSSSSSGKSVCGSRCSRANNPAFTLVWDTASQLWKDNPERDLFNTFSVSEQELTCAIAHLETQLGARLPAALPEVDESGVEDGEGVVPPPEGAGAELPFRIKFILDSYCNIFWMRKQDLRELKLLQKQENKQYQDLVYKNEMSTDAQMRKFEADMQNLLKNYEQDMETLTKQQKQAVEKAELMQQQDMKTTGRRIKAEQEKELRMFREKQKQEMKLLKQELDMMPRGDNKKENVRKLREAKEIELQEKERLFLETQAERLEKTMRQLADQHRQKIALLESQFLQQKQQLLRAREAAVWEMEKEQLHEKNQLAKCQLKDMFFLKRHQMLTRHQKELDQMKHYNTKKEEEMQTRHALEKRRLPKILKAEAKTRAQMFKQSLRLSTIGTPDDDKVKIKQFEENEKKRMKAEQQRQEAKHKKQWEELIFKNETALRELEQLQAEKRKLLMEQETQKIKELEEQYANELRAWKAMLVPRKQKLEEEFFRQKEEQEKFYGASQQGEGEAPNMSHLYSASSASLRSKDSAGSMSSRHSTVI